LFNIDDQKTLQHEQLPFHEKAQLRIKK